MIMKKLIFIFVQILLPIVARADVVVIDGIKYNLVDKAESAEVSRNNYTGNIQIPETIRYDGKTFRVTGIGDKAFMDCASLISVIMPNSILYIGNEAFEGCSGLTSIIIPNVVTSIGDKSFAGCSGLTSITIPNSVTSIGDQAFVNCSGLASINVENGNTTYDSRENCNAIIKTENQMMIAGCKNTVIPNGVISIYEAFCGCSDLTSITIPNSVTSISTIAFYGCSGLTSITIPNSVTDFGVYSFSGCTGLTTITIPNSVTEINYHVFRDCSGLTTINIGKNVTSIGLYVFAGCKNLNHVYCFAERVPSIDNTTFQDSFIEYATLHVPSSSVSAYQQADNWKKFKEIVAIEDVPTPKCEKPTIAYDNGQLKFASTTQNVDFITDITDVDIKKHFDATISLTATYNICVYATKSGYDNSDVATATLCWIDKEPTTEGITDGVAQIPSQAVLIQSEGGILKVEGINEGMQVLVYTPDGKQVGSAVCRNGAALVGTSIQPGNTAIVKIGEKSVKVIMK